jgi:MarR family
MGKLTTDQYVLTATERAIMEAVFDGTIRTSGGEHHGMYPSTLARRVGRSESTVVRLARSLAARGLLERQQDGDTGDSYWRTTTAGTLFPDLLGRPGRVTALCGHGIAGSEWRAGFRWCEQCGN